MQERVPAPLRVVLAILIMAPGVALGLYWIFNHSGPYGWLVDVQASLIEAYYPKATGVITLFVALAITAGPILLLCMLSTGCFRSGPTSAIPVKRRTIRFLGGRRESRTIQASRRPGAGEPRSGC